MKLCEVTSGIHSYTNIPLRGIAVGVFNECDITFKLSQKSDKKTVQKPYSWKLEKIFHINLLSQ